MSKKFNLFILLLLTITMSGCFENNTNESIPNDLTSSNVSILSGTQGRLIPIQSDNVAYAGYDSISQIMSVQFKEGSIYEYYNVPIDIWNAFIEAQPHPWSTVGKPFLVDGGFAYRRVS